VTNKGNEIRRLKRRLKHGCRLTKEDRVLYLNDSVKKLTLAATRDKGKQLHAHPEPLRYTAARGTVRNPDSIAVTAVHGECLSVQAPQNVAARGEVVDMVRTRFRGLGGVLWQMPRGEKPSAAFFHARGHGH
jgi:hypothetical protein